MTEAEPTRDEMEAAMRALLVDAELPEPDEVLPHEGGGIVCLWHEQKVAIVVDPDDPPLSSAVMPLPGERLH